MIDEIITDILKAEGWDTYTNDPADRGGPTKWGITQEAWSGHVGHDATPDEIKRISESQARYFYEMLYINAPRFNLLPDRLKPMVIDCGVNHGTRAASKWVQRAAGVKADGVIGPVTLDAVLAENPLAMYTRICAYRFKLYGRIISDDHSQAKWAAGWNNRGAKWLLRLADSLTGG